MTERYNPASLDWSVCVHWSRLKVHKFLLTPDRFLRQVEPAEEWSMPLIGVFGAQKNSLKDAEQEGKLEGSLSDSLKCSGALKFVPWRSCENANGGLAYREL